MKRKIPYLFLLPNLALGLSLSDLAIQSSLNQPLKAEVQLYDLGKVAPADIHVTLASPENYTKLGLEKNDVLSQLKLNINKSKNGQAVINITSDQPISEPYLELLLDIRWSGGELTRAFTLLLDPPNYALNEDVQEEKDEIKEAPQQKVALSDKTYGPVLPDENLWHIADKVRAGTNITVNQMMILLLKSNPDAFIRQNMNGLKVGEKLILPDLKSKILSDEEAKNQVFKQMKAWYKEADDTTEEKSDGTTEVAKTEPSKTKPDDLNLKLNPVVTKSAENSPLMTESKNLNDSEKTLRAELAVSAEATSTARETTTILREQLSNLQKQNQQLQDELHKRDHDLDDLKTQLQTLTQMIKQQSAKATAGQSYALESDGFSIIPLLILLLVFGTGGAAYWIYRPSLSNISDYLNNLISKLKKSQPENFFQDVKEETSEPIEIKERPIVKRAERTVILDEPIVKTPVENPIISVKPVHQTTSAGNTLDYEPVLNKKPSEPTQTETSSILTNPDSVRAKLELAKSYIESQSYPDARVVLKQILEEGNEVQQAEAARLLAMTLK